MGYNVTEYIPRRCCTDDRLKRLRKAGFTSSGYEHNLENILTSKGFGLPGDCEDGFGFMFKKYTRIYLNYSDALAEEILFLNKECELFP